MGVVKLILCVFLVMAVIETTQGKSLYEQNPFLQRVPIIAPLPNAVHPTLLPDSFIRQHNVPLIIPPAAHQPGLHSPNPSAGAKHQPGGTITVPSHSQNPVQPQQPASQPATPLLPPITPIPPAIPPIAILPQPTLKEPEAEVNHLRAFCRQARGQFPNSKCNKFVNCWDNTAVEQFCPEGLAFNPAGYCDYLYNVDCKGRSFEAPPASKGSPPSPNLILPSPPSDFNNNLVPSVNQGAPQVPSRQNPFLSSNISQIFGQTTQKPIIVQQPVLPSLAQVQQPSPSLPLTGNSGSPAVPSRNPFLPANVTQILSQGGVKPQVISQPVYPNQPPVQQPAQQPSGFIPIGAAPARPTLSQNPFLPPNVSQVLGQTTQKPIVVQQPLLPNLPPVQKLPSNPSPPFIDSGNASGASQKPSQNPFLPANVSQLLWQANQKPTVVQQPLLPNPPPVQKLPSNPSPPFILTGSAPAAPSKPSQNPFLPTNVTELLSQTTQKPIVAQQPVFPNQPTTNFINNPPPPSPSVPLDIIPAGTVPVNPVLKAKCMGLRGQFPTEDCHKYVDCWDGNALELECPPGLYFSEKGYCDFPANVNCNNRTAAKAAQKVTQCPSPNGTFRDKSNCSRYFTCISNEVVSKYECPLGLQFNEVICVCDYSQNVNCAREPFVYQPMPNEDMLQKVPAVAVDATMECKPGRVFRLNSDCSSVVLCRLGSTEAIHCPTGLFYDAPTDRCLPPQLARCQDS